MKNKEYVKFEFPITLPDFDFVYEAINNFIFQLNPSRKELKEIKIAVEEAVTNSCLHAYPEEDGAVYICCRVIKPYVLEIIVKDKGIGIDNVADIKEMLIDSSDTFINGLGFRLMKEHMDDVKVKSILGKGTTVCLRKTITGK